MTILSLRREVYLNRTKSTGRENAKDQGVRDASCLLVNPFAYADSGLA